MRLPAVFLSCAIFLVACGTVPLAQRQSGYFTGRMTSARQVGVENENGSNWALWMADIQLLGRRDPSDPDTVTAYYFQNWHTNYTIVEGTTTTVRYEYHSLACPGWPLVQTNRVSWFLFRRRDIGNDKNALYLESVMVR